jgi:hypothetical protein
MSASVAAPGWKPPLLAALSEIDRKIAALPAGEAKPKLAELAARARKAIELIVDRAPAAKKEGK